MLGISKVNRILITSDFLLQSGLGLITPIFALFLTGQIKGATIAAVGFVAATYWFTKAIVQPFIARFLDIKKGERDDFKFLIAGMYVANLVPIGYLFATNIIQIILLEFIRGLAMACVIPTWAAIFTRHMDRGWEAFSWSIESTGISLAAGFSGALGGILAQSFGFGAVFIAVSVFGLIATTTLFSIRKDIYLRDHFEPAAAPLNKPF